MRMNISLPCSGRSRQARGASFLRRGRFPNRRHSVSCDDFDAGRQVGAASHQNEPPGLRYGNYSEVRSLAAYLRFAHRYRSRSGLDADSSCRCAAERRVPLDRCPEERRRLRFRPEAWPFRNRDSACDHRPLAGSRIVVFRWALWPRTDVNEHTRTRRQQRDRNHGFGQKAKSA